ncbi:MAG: phosphoenolpyruvate carboxykinase [Alphaproteobacteria bacterium]|nr:phosphoenolpyruvate carboxykinase [Alphaproteobacteria bacterium]
MEESLDLAEKSSLHIAPRFGLVEQGMHHLGPVHWNLSVPFLYEHAIRRREGELGAGGTFVANTGPHTGRSPRDKYIVREAGTESTVAWGNINQPITPAQFSSLHQRVLAYLQGRELFVQDLYAGADPEYRLPVRVVTPNAWHALFARNMFIRPPAAELGAFEPAFTILHAPDFHSIPELDGIRSKTFVFVNFAERVVLIGGTRYAGEIKKSVFGYLNFVLPSRDVLPMHCSANVGPNGDSAIFFGLSGTGKTTLSADPNRTLIGDDEHGWSPRGLFNFEGGCYAKVINLSPKAEPEIYATITRFGTVLENVVIDPVTRMPDVDDASLTENTRACYPLDFIPNADEHGLAPHPANVIMLTCDAFGVMPPIAQLNAEQAMYHFLSGYTARVAGTEVGLGSEPQATFSTCFGAPFMPRHPSEYAKMLGERISRYGAKCWLVNTGWSGGAYGVGSRMAIQHTRGLLRAVLDGRLASAPMRKDTNFGFLVPESAPEIPAEVLDPRATWANKTAYDETARGLTRDFEKNFVGYEPYVGNDIKSVAIRAAA